MLTQQDIQNRIESIEKFIHSGEYKKYKNWKQTPIFYKYYWIRNGFGKSYLTDDLKFNLDKITYFEYKSSNAVCPYPIKNGYRWCKYCENEFEIKLFGVGKQICKECAKVYRRDNYYEAGRIQSKINYHTKPEEKLHTLIRVYVNGAMKGNKKTKRSKEILGMEFEDFREYIQSKWEPWMNWDNYGHGVGKWCIQHIVPKVFAQTEAEIYLLNNYNNLIPMDFSDNGILKDKILDYQLNEWHANNCKDIINRNKESIVSIVC